VRRFAKTVRVLKEYLVEAWSAQDATEVPLGGEGDSSSDERTLRAGNDPKADFMAISIAHRVVSGPICKWLLAVFA